MRSVEAAPALGIARLTVFAFSADNWRRPPAEVQALMGLLRDVLHDQAERHARTGTRLTFIGRRDRLPAALVEAMAQAEAETAVGRRLSLRIALDYSSRDAIASAVTAAGSALGLTRDAMGRLIAQAPAGDDASPDVDLLIRTGGEKRLSDFLLWECAYAELLFLDTMWPDFTPAALAAAVAAFGRRERRFGGLSPAPAAASA